MIKYIGSKRTLVPVIVEVVKGFTKARSVIDLFSGTSRVGHALKREGYRIIANDYNAYAYTLAQCYIETDLEEVESDARKLIDEFNRLSGKAGYFTETFCQKARFFHPKNGKRIDAIREAIEKKGLPKNLKSVLLVSLMEAADRVDSTTGLQMAYLKEWAPRAYNDLELRLPVLLNRARYGKGRAFQLEAKEATKKLKADIAYIDPPYNQHSYLGNYHVWETLILWDKPTPYGLAQKRIDCRSRKSEFNSKTQFYNAFHNVITRVQAKVLIVSFNNEGYISRENMEELLSKRGAVQTIEQDYKRYVGAQIGIHNPQGEKVGSVSHLRNKEYLYVAGALDSLFSEDKPSGKNRKCLPNRIRTTY